MTPTRKKRCNSRYCTKEHYHCPGCGKLLSTGGYVGTCMGRCGGCDRHVHFVDFDEGWELLAEGTGK